MVLWKMITNTFSLLLVVALAFTSGVLSLLLYAKITGKDWVLIRNPYTAAVFAEAPKTPVASASPTPEPAPTPVPLKPSAMIDAPVIRQRPELPSGCEITSLTMLFNYYGIDKNKMELTKEMKYDQTPLKLGPRGEVISWGNPNTGYVGDPTGQTGRGFGIYHTALAELLQTYIPTGVDITGGEFEDLERQIQDDKPVVVWTTLDFNVPDRDRWVVWDTPLGPIRTTFMEHSVLLVGYDEQYVYVNDPYTGKANVQIDKARFIETWEVMGKQAISYK
ncbi:C39 family peptidase [Paenibacillus sp. MBLB4367]|uniref:C39 family peptidase n=1 Tax=Paenibacillus sp. MBLB4367 TaxID=3384767 RepID=UPI00390824B2